MENINARVEDSVFLDLAAVAKYVKVPRSEIARNAIQFFMQEGTIVVEGKELSFQQVLNFAHDQLKADGLELEDLISRKEPKEEDSHLRPEAKKMIKEHLSLMYEGAVDILGEKN